MCHSAEMMDLCRNICFKAWILVYTLLYQVDKFRDCIKIWGYFFPIRLKVQFFNGSQWLYLVFSEVRWNMKINIPNHSLLIWNLQKCILIEIEEYFSIFQVLQIFIFIYILFGAVIIVIIFSFFYNQYFY